MENTYLLRPEMKSRLQRRLIRSERIVNTLENDNQFFIVNDWGLSVAFASNDARFSPPFEKPETTNETTNETIFKLIEDERQKSYLAGLIWGLKVAKTIMNRHFANHKLLEPHSPEKLRSFDEIDIAEAFLLPET